MFGANSIKHITVRIDTRRREASIGSEHLINNGHETEHGQRLDRANKTPLMLTRGTVTP
jgi:hypothetical protein